MTVSTTQRVARYVGNGATTDFAFNFPILSEADLSVFLYDSTTKEATLTTNYTVTGIGDPNGGEVSMTTAPTSDQTVIVKRTTDLVQNLDLMNQGGFYPEVIEAQLDKIALQVQDLSEAVGRAPKMLEGENFTKTFGFKVDLSGKVLTFDSDGEPLATKSLADLGGTVQDILDEIVLQGLEADNALHLTIDSPDGFSTRFGYESFAFGSLGTFPAVRGPIAFLTTAKDLEPFGAGNLWGVRVNKLTGVNPNVDTDFSGGLYVWSEAQTGFAGAIRGAAVIAEVAADAGATSSVALNIQSNMRKAHAGQYSIALDIAARSYDQNVSSISGEPIAIEAEVAGYLDDDTAGGDGRRQAYNARSANLDFDNILTTPAYFGAAFRATNTKTLTLSGISWFKKGFHASGGGPNGGIIDGFTADRVQDRGLHVIRPGTAGIEIDLGINPHSLASPVNAILIAGGNTTSANIKVLQEGNPTRISFGSKHQTLLSRLATIDTIGLNDAAEDTIYSEIFTDLEVATDGAESGRLFMRTMRAGTLTLGMRLDDVFSVFVPVNSTVSEYRSNGVKVVGARGSAVANATDAASAITQLNALLSRVRDHGLIAP